MTSGVRSVICAPLVAHDRVGGVLYLHSSSIDRTFNDEHLRLVTAAAHQVANAMNNAELYSLIRDQAERLGLMLRQEQVEATKSSAILDSVAEGVMVADVVALISAFDLVAPEIDR